MIVDFSILKNIDFTNTDNLLFLSIIFVLTIIILLVFLFIAAKIIKEIKGLIRRLFNIDSKKPNLNQKEGADWLHRPQDAKEVKEVNDVPKQKVVGGDFIRNFNADEKKSEEKQKDAVKSYKEKEEKSISQHLGKLKTDKGEERETLESKMPSMQAAEEGEEYEKIKIPMPKRFSTGDMQSEDSAKENKNTDSSIFEGGSEISRIKLEGKMKRDPKVWQAQKQTGLNLSPVERAKLVKEVFSPVYGSNISRTDLKGGIRKLSQKMLNVKDPQERANIRKEIKFFKKIGGIK